MYEYKVEEFQYWNGQSKYLSEALTVRASEGWELDKIFDPWAATNRSDPKLVLVFRRRKKEHEIIAQEIAREELVR